MSEAALVSPAARSEAKPEKATTLPSRLIDGLSLFALPAAPPGVRLTSSTLPRFGPGPTGSAAAAAPTPVAAIAAQTPATAPALPHLCEITMTGTPPRHRWLAAQSYSPSRRAGTAI